MNRMAGRTNRRAVNRVQATRWLHAISRVLILHRHHQLVQAKASHTSSAKRRSRQQQRTLRNLLQGPAFQAMTPNSLEPLFWRALRWGGPALALGAWLATRG